MLSMIRCQCSDSNIDISVGCTYDFTLEPTSKYPRPAVVLICLRRTPYLSKTP
jgi:hypothetical protein